MTHTTVGGGWYPRKRFRSLYVLKGGKLDSAFSTSFFETPFLRVMNMIIHFSNKLRTALRCPNGKTVVMLTLCWEELAGLLMSSFHLFFGKTFSFHILKPLVLDVLQPQCSPISSLHTHHITSLSPIQPRLYDQDVSPLLSHSPPQKAVVLKALQN